MNDRGLLLKPKLSPEAIVSFRTEKKVRIVRLCFDICDYKLLFYGIHWHENTKCDQTLFPIAKYHFDFSRLFNQHSQYV